MLFDETFYYAGTEYVHTIIRVFPGPWNDFISQHDRYYGLWFASASTRLEVEHYFFSNTRLVFCSPEDLETFADRFSTNNCWSLLRLVGLQVSGDWDAPPLNKWMSACARLPPNLVSIQFSVSRYTLKGSESHGEWFIVKHSPLSTFCLELRCAVVSINALGKLAHRVAAKAKIGLAVEILDPETETKLRPCTISVRVLDDLEPWSKNWLDWWEEETKVNLEGDKAFNKAT